MKWFERHLNWTIVIFLVFTLVVFIITLGTDFNPPRVVVVILGVISYIVFGWVLRKKNRSLWWLLLNLTAFGWILYLALDNKTFKYSADERDTVLDLIRWWFHTLKSLDLANKPIEATSSQSLDGFVSKEAFDSSLSDSVSMIETIQHHSMDTYQWPTLTNSESTSLLADIKRLMNEFFTLEFEGVRLMREYTYLVDDKLLIATKGATDLKSVTKRLNQIGKQAAKTLYKLAKIYHISTQDYVDIGETA